jgi:hypothetical protein
MMSATMTWVERLDEPKEIELRIVEEGRRNIPEGQVMLFPNGRAVDDLIRMIPAGQARTQKELRTALAERYDADITCPVTTRHCLHTVAEAAYEAAQHGTPLDDVTPVWRVSDFSAPMLRKLSFDPDFLLVQAAREREPTR